MYHLNNEVTLEYNLIIFSLIFNLVLLRNIFIEVQTKFYKKIQ